MAANPQPVSLELASEAVTDLFYAWAVTTEIMLANGASIEHLASALVVSQDRAAQWAPTDQQAVATAVLDGSLTTRIYRPDFAQAARRAILTAAGRLAS